MDRSSPDRALMDRLAPLGFRRSVLLGCLGGRAPGAPGSFVIPRTGSVLEAYRAYIDEVSARPGWLDHPQTRLLVAAGRLLCGEIAWAAGIVEALPERAPALRYGQAYCPLMAVRTLAAVLPLPDGLGPPETWTAGSPEQATLRAWLARHGPTLRWHEAEARYRVPGTGGTGLGDPDMSGPATLAPGPRP